MALKSRLRVMLWLTVIVSAVVFAQSWMRFSDVHDHNAAVAAQDFEAAGRHPGDAGAFARAFAASSRGALDEARAGYGTIDAQAPARLAAATHYNLANSYLRQALAYDPQQERDLALPLLELAKAGYREALRLDDTLWDARMNLALTLRTLPDTVDEKPMELEFDTGPVRTIISADTEENLP